MKHNLHRFAPVGLVIAGLAALVSFGLYIVFRLFDLRLQISLGFIVIGLAIYILLDPQKALATITGRQARHGTNSFLMAAAVIGIVVVINYLVSQYSKQWDLTEDKQNTLATETISTLESLPSKVTAEVFYSSQISSTNVEKLLRNYQANSKGKFEIELIDPVKDPIRAQQANITRDGTVVLKMGDRQEQITSTSEEEITSALVRLSNPGERTIYFLSGHGEYATDGSSEKNYSLAANTLKAKNYTIKALNLISDPQIPADALAVIIAGPQKPITEAEINLLNTYQANGGSLVYLAEPRLLTEFGDQADPMITYLDTTWGIKLDEDNIIDFSTSNNNFTIAGQYNSHAITNRLNSMAVMLPTARTVRAGESRPEGVTLTELALTTVNAWGETDLAALQQGQAAPDSSKDHIGPVSFAVAGENATTKARVVVIGDADFAGQDYFNQLGNGDFFINSIDWAAQQDNLISLTPREKINRVLIAPQGASMNLVLLGAIFVLPGLVILTGITVWLQRRRRG